MRYPLAMPGMPQELKTQAKRIVADVIEDKTGHRPTLEKFDPDIKLEGGSVKLSLNGLPPDALASLKPEALLVDVTTRAKDYVVRVLTLTAYVAETQELLDLETDVIKNTMDGLAVEEGKVADAGDDLSELKVELDEASSIAAANSAKGAVTAKGSAKSARHPVRLTSCDGTLPKADDKGKGDKGKGDKPAASAPAKGDKPAHGPPSTQAPPAKKKESVPLID